MKLIQAFALAIGSGFIGAAGAQDRPVLHPDANAPTFSTSPGITSSPTGYRCADGWQIVMTRSGWAMCARDLREPIR